MDNMFTDKLNDHEKMMYARWNNTKDGVLNDTPKIPLVSPINDMIDFNPFQYIPFAKLKMQKEYPKVVYIADEVGAGKTIETGIIITELLYNKEIKLSEQKCLIICPNLLCHKWKYTLRTLFGVNSIIIHSMEDIVNGISIVSFDTISINRADIDNLKLQMLIIDEAHNASGDRFKKVMEVRSKVCNESGYVICLSATPVAGDKNDAAKQENLLRGEKKSENIFESGDDKHYLCKNRKKYMRYAVNPDAYIVNTVVNNHFVTNKELGNFVNISKELFAGKNTLLMFQGLNALMSSPAAASLYFVRILKKTDKEFLEYLQSSSEISIDIDDESEDDEQEVFYKGADEYTIEDARKIKEKLEVISKKNIEILKNTEKDKKLDELKKIIEKNEKQFTENTAEHEFFGHIIIFTDKISTAKYLERELKNKYNYVFRVTGELFESEKLNRLHQYKAVKNDICILIITNVACEGQDMDFGNTIINYDLDYNPVRLEQRRGRVDRFRVKKNSIYIHNFAVEEFDYNPEDPKKEYHTYSKIKRIFDKIELIKKTTDIFYEILLSFEKYKELHSDEKLDIERNEKDDIDAIVKNVYRNVFDIVSADKPYSIDVPTSTSELKEYLNEEIFKSLCTDNRKYQNIYEYVNELLKISGITVETIIDNSVNGKDDIKYQITTNLKNQDFLSNVFHGGTLISHIINRE